MDDILKNRAALVCFDGCGKMCVFVWYVKPVGKRGLMGRVVLCRSPPPPTLQASLRHDPLALQTTRYHAAFHQFLDSAAP